MKTPINHKMQALPASFFTLAVSCSILMMVAFFNTALSLVVYGDTSLTLSDNLRRVALVKVAMNAPEDINQWDVNDIKILFNSPSLKRVESEITALHYHGESCALDIYVANDAQKPDYIEFRTLSLNSDIEAQFNEFDTASLNMQCLQDVLATQGVNTPNSYATRPTPTWANPYRT